MQAQAQGGPKAGETADGISQDQLALLQAQKDQNNFRQQFGHGGSHGTGAAPHPPGHSGHMSDTTKDQNLINQIIQMSNEHSKQQQSLAQPVPPIPGAISGGLHRGGLNPNMVGGMGPGRSDSLSQPQTIPGGPPGQFNQSHNNFQRNSG